MPSYKLSYFPGRALAEVKPHLLFTLPSTISRSLDSSSISLVLHLRTNASLQRSGSTTKDVSCKNDISFQLHIPSDIFSQEQNKRKNTNTEINGDCSDSIRPTSCSLCGGEASTSIVRHRSLSSKGVRLGILIVNSFSRSTNWILFLCNETSSRCKHKAYWLQATRVRVHSRRHGSMHWPINSRTISMRSDPSWWLSSDSEMGTRSNRRETSPCQPSTNSSPFWKRQQRYVSSLETWGLKTSWGQWFEWSLRGRFSHLDRPCRLRSRRNPRNHCSQCSRWLSSGARH